MSLNQILSTTSMISPPPKVSTNFFYLLLGGVHFAMVAEYIGFGFDPYIIFSVEDLNAYDIMECCWRYLSYPVSFFLLLHILYEIMVIVCEFPHYSSGKLMN